MFYTILEWDKPKISRFEQIYYNFFIEFWVLAVVTTYGGNKRADSLFPNICPKLQQNIKSNISIERESSICSIQLWIKEIFPTDIRLK